MEMIAHYTAAALACVALAALALNAGPTRKPLPDGTIPDGLGVNIHFTGDRPQLDMIAQGGFRFIRMDLIWEAIEKQKGVYDFAESGYDALSEGCVKRGIRPLYILDYSNRLYETDRSVRTEEGRAAYASFAEAAARHFAGKGFLFEIWNEPNISIFWKPEPNADDYMAMLKAAAPRIKAADPTCTLVAPACSGMDMKWLEECFKLGMLDEVDAVTVHPYRPQSPETVIPDYAALRALIAKHAPKGKNVPILSGEWGYSGVNWDGRRLSDEAQAQYLAREFLVDLSQDIPVSIWYDWSNDSPNPDDRESNFGTVTHDLKPKPAYMAAKTLATSLAGYKVEKRLDLAGRDDYALLLTKGGEKAVAAWTTGADHEARIPLPPGAGRLVKMLGETSPLSWGEGGPGLTLTQGPCYVLVGE
jgi:beta-xylosidase